MAPSLERDDTRSQSAATTISSGGTKRKRGSDKPKFYAVRVGKEPGIYHSWADCQQQITGVKNTKFKSFLTLSEAEAYMKGDSAAEKESSRNSPTKFYAVQSGRVPGVYTSWPEAEAQIVGWKQPKHKKFATLSEAEAFVRAGASVGEAVSNVAIQDNMPSESATTTPAKKKGAVVGEKPPPAKKSKKNGTNNGEQAISSEPPEPGGGPLPPGAEDGFDRRIILDPEKGVIRYKTAEEMSATKMQPTGNIKEGPLVIYTDGSSLGNGQKGAIGGVGVFFGPNDKRNVSEALVGARQTNQRAELTAILRALEMSPVDREVLIYSDSNYAIQCVTVWFQNWRKNGWMTSAKKPVENKDLVQEIIEIIERRASIKVSTKFVWLKGHADDPGNNAADRLAVEGARNAKADMAAGVISDPGP